MSSFFLLLKAAEEEKNMLQQKKEEEEESLIIYLKKELESTLIRNDSLEKENRDLRQEIIRLKAQISSLKAHDNERKSLLWKKLQNSNESSQQKPSESDNPKLLQVLPNPPPPKLASAFNSNKLPPPTVSSKAPPPPPPPSKMFMASKSVRRVPEVAEFYRLLTKRNVSIEDKSNSNGASPITAFSPNMIGEIENRSTHLSAIKSDVENRKEYINYLIKEIESAAFKSILEVETFVQWLDNELSSLVDERAVLKHFKHWPERKSDAMREAAFNYRDLRNLEMEVSGFEDNPKEPLKKALGKMQALQDRLERSVTDTERTRESIIKKYKDFQIPWEWLLDSGLIGQMKLSSMRVAKAYMKRIIKELQPNNECLVEENILLQGARFAYRVHQFAGGFDAETIIVFQELKKVAMVGSDNKLLIIH